MFVYSPRRGTPAAVWHAANAVPHDVAQDRFLRLKAVQDEAVRAYHDRKIGTTVRALIHGVSRKDRTRLSGQDDRQRHGELPAGRSRAGPVAPVGRRARRIGFRLGCARNVHRPRAHVRGRRRPGRAANDRPARRLARLAASGDSGLRDDAIFVDRDGVVFAERVFELVGVLRLPAGEGVGRGLRDGLVCSG